MNPLSFYMLCHRKMGVRNREYAEMVKLLKAYGCKYIRNHGGSHEVRRNPETGVSFTLVKPHGGDKISTDGTFLGMLDKAGITKSQAKAFKDNKYKRKNSAL